MPTIAAQCSRLAKQAVKERQPYLGYLEALLSAELEERERNVVQRRIRDAHLPRLKTLEDFDFSQSPKVPATQLHIEVPAGGASGDHRWSVDQRWSPAELWLQRFVLRRIDDRFAAT